MSVAPRLRRIVKASLKVVLALLAATVISVLLLRFIAPPASALMIERRIASWFGTADYSPKYTWVSLDEISPSMGIAVIAAEDQNFLGHYGFDWAAIQR